MTRRNILTNLCTLLVTAGLLALAFPNALLADSANLPKTGQTKCYHQDGYEIVCPETGQDGDIQAGVAWPDPRFTDNGDGTITDHLTGLMWLKDGECFGEITWQAALDAAAGFNQDPASYNCYQYNHQALTYTDWRVPNINELPSLVNAGEPLQYEWLNNNGFYNVSETYYWTSTSYSGYADYAWYIHLSNGREGWDNIHKGSSSRTMLVRSAQ